ncbi:MAG: hypothetical protein KGO05_00895, partial [Chloroflexota bacterium]|nr:hypothetical protein [Chloroflexota bacterium]
LEQRARELSSQKQMLTTYLAMLKNELLMLKCKCLEHSDCGCDGIRDYLKNTVNTMTPANAALYSKLEDKNIEDIENEIARKQSSAASGNRSRKSWSRPECDPPKRAPSDGCAPYCRSSPA